MASAVRAASEATRARSSGPNSRPLTEEASVISPITRPRATRGTCRAGPSPTRSAQASVPARATATGCTSRSATAGAEPAG